MVCHLMLVRALSLTQGGEYWTSQVYIWVYYCIWAARCTVCDMHCEKINPDIRNLSRAVLQWLGENRTSGCYSIHNELCFWDWSVCTWGSAERNTAGDQRALWQCSYPATAEKERCGHKHWEGYSLKIHLYLSGSLVWVWRARQASSIQTSLPFHPGPDPQLVNVLGRQRRVHVQHSWRGFLSWHHLLSPPFQFSHALEQ